MRVSRGPLAPGTRRDAVPLALSLLRLALQVLLQPAARAGSAQLLQRTRLDLAHALARHAEALPDLLERARAPVPQPVAQPQHVGLALGERRVEELVEVVRHRPALDRGGRLRLLVVEHRLERRPRAVGLLLARDGRLHRDGRDGRGAVNLLQLGDGQVEVRGELGVGRRARVLVRQLALRLAQRVDEVVHVHRQPDRARVVGDGARDRLPDPPRGVRGEAEAARRVELLGRLDQPDRALLDQVLQRQPLVHVLFRDRDHQAQVGRDEQLLRLLHALLLANVLGGPAGKAEVRSALVVRRHALEPLGQGAARLLPLQQLLHRGRQVVDLLRREQPLLANVLEVPAHRVVAAAGRREDGERGATLGRVRRRRRRRRPRRRPRPRTAAAACTWATCPSP
mmetsp:Transcript_8723/g.14686  ORF Transcript_8723/g.14686 Transcript_8723/m.14686 type:complete len:397 (-) Transcript_8723:1129-2319(-)